MLRVISHFHFIQVFSESLKLKVESRAVECIIALVQIIRMVICCVYNRVSFLVALVHLQLFIFSHF